MSRSSPLHRWSRVGRAGALRVLALVTLLLPRLVHALPATKPLHGMPGFILTHDDGGTATVMAGTTTSTTFTFTYAGTQTNVPVNLVTTVCNGALASCYVSPSSATMSTGDVISVTVYMTGGTFPGSGTVTLAAKNATTGSQYIATSVSVTVSPSLQVSTAPHAGMLIDVSGCIADCFETVSDYTTPAYISRGVPRSVTLQYRSGRAKPYGRLALDAIDPSPGITAFRLQLKYPNGSYVTFTNGSTSLFFTRNTSGTTRLMAEFDAAAVSPSSSAYQYTAEVTSYVAAGTQVTMVPTAVRIIVLNDINSPFGAGVDAVGIQRAITQTDGALITDGAGSASFFAGTCAIGQNNCVFTSPSGDFSTLTTYGGEYLRKYPDGTMVKINQTTGVMTAVLDPFGTSTTIGSVWIAEFNKYMPLQITDPEQQYIAFIYRDAALAGTTYKQGSIGAINIRGSRYANLGVLPSGNLEHLVDPDGIWFSWRQYDAQHLLTLATDRNGGSTNYTYRYGKTIDYVDAPTIAVDGGGNVRPRTIFREYLSDLYTAAIAGGGTTQATAIAKGSALAQVIDPGNHTTQFTLDRWNQPLTITDALNRTSTITRDAIGRATQIVSFTGATDVAKYNGQDLVMTQPAGKDSTNYRWHTASIVIPGTAIPVNVTLMDSTWGPRQAWRQLVYAANTAIQSVKSRYVQGDPTLFTTTYTTDAYGRVLTATDNAGHVTKTTYTGRYKNTDSTIAAAGQYATTVYDVEGRDSLTWMSGRRDLFSSALIKDRTLYDALNRVVSVSDGIRPAVTYEYGPIFLNKVRDRLGQVFRFDYNALGWETKQYDPADTVNWTRSVQYAYNVDGQVTTKTNRRGQAITTAYDALHRETSISSVSGTDNFGYSTDGLRTAAWNNISTDSSFFRANGWQDSVVTRIGGQRFRTRYMPDIYLRLDSIDIAGTGIQFAGRKYLYDPTLNVLNTIRFASYFGATLQRNNEALLTGAAYLMASGGTRSRTLSITTAHQVYRDGISGLSTGYDKAYGYDSLGRFSEWTDKPDILPIAGGVNTFTYDNNRLYQDKRFTLAQNQGQWPTCPAPSAAYGYNCASLAQYQNAFDRAQYTFDNAENRTYDLREGGGPVYVTGSSSTLGTFDPGDRLKTATGNASYGSGDNLAPFSNTTLNFSRDLDGNLIRRYGATTDIQYGWDALGRLDTVKVAATGATVIYDYNALGQLVRRRTNGTVDRHFLWEDDNLLAELDGAATSRIGEYVYWGLDQPLAIVTGAGAINEVNYHVQDALGNVKLLFNQNPQSPVNFQTDYSDWGTPVNTTWGVIPNRLLFKGMMYEGDSTKLYYARSRWYSPEIGGFMSEDPLSIGGGSNTYAFAEGDPVNGSDSFGLNEGPNPNNTFGLPNYVNSIAPRWLPPSDPFGPCNTPGGLFSRGNVATLLPRLVDAQDAAMQNPAFQPDENTYCNQATVAIARKVGAPTAALTDRSGAALLANTIAANLAKQGSRYHEVGKDEAQRLANDGCFVVATLAAPRHGHVVSLRPNPAGIGEWPLVANVGTFTGVAPMTRTSARGPRGVWGQTNAGRVKFYTPDP